MGKEFNVKAELSTPTETVTREAVLAAACQLFAARGYMGTSMKDIAGRLSVRAPSLYNHVASKRDILVTIMDRALRRALNALEESLEGVDDVRDQLRAATESLVLDFLRNTDEVTVSNNDLRVLDGEDRIKIVAMREEYGQRVRAILERGHAEGKFHVGDPRIASFAILEMGNGAKAWFRPGGELSDLDVARMYGDFALRMVDSRDEV
jgi:AcrR family transcriptional regulator